MADITLCNLLKVINRDPDSKFDCETLKKILSEKEIRSEVAQIEDGWLIRVDCSSFDVITKSKWRLIGEFKDQAYYLVFKITDEPFPDPYSSLNVSCTGNPKGTILVSNYPTSTTAGSLLNFFENHADGGTIQHIHFEQDHACITFSNPEVAENVTSKGPIPFNGKLLRIDKDDYNNEKPTEKYPEPAEKYPEPAEKYPEPAEKYPEPAEKYPKPAEKYPKPAKRNLPKTATKTVCVGNVPEEMDLEILEVFFQNKKNGGGKMEKNPTRNLQTNDVEITFADEKTAKGLVEKSPMTYNNCTFTITLKKPFQAEKIAEKKTDANPVIYDRQTILVYGVPENISLDEVKLYFQNTKSSKGGKIRNCEIYKKKGIKITFVSSEIVNNVLKKNDHAIGGNSLEVRMYIPPKMEEKQLVISDIKHNVLTDSLENYLAVDIDLDVDTVKMVQPGVWLVYCNNKIDIEKVKSDLKDKNRKFISETYAKAKQVELTDKIIVRNIPEKYSVDHIENYFTNPLDPDHCGSAKMLPGRRCIVTFKDYNIAAMWAKAKHDKFDCDLFYDYEDEDEDVTFMEINISSNFTLQFIINHKNVFEEELKDYGYFVWSESQGNSLKIMFNKGIKEKEIKRKVNELLNTIFEEELIISPNIYPELKETYRHESDAVHVYFDDKNHMVHILSFNKTLAEENKKNFLCVVESKSKTSETLELSPHKISLLYADLFPSKIFTKYKILKINKEAKKIILTGSLSDINDVTREIYKYLSEVLSIQCHLPRNASKIVSKKKVKEYLQKNLKKDSLICSWELNPENEVIIYSVDNKNLISARNIFQKGFIELDFDLTDPIKKLMKGEKWQAFLNNMSTKYVDIFHINDQQDDKITIITTKEFSQNLGDDFGKFFDTHVIYTSTLPLKPGFFEFLKTFCQEDVQQFSDDNMPMSIQFRDDQMVHISGTNNLNNMASEYLKKLTKTIIEKREVISHLGFQRFLKSAAADTMFRKLSKNYKCIILQDEDNTKNILKRPSADVGVKQANSSIRIHAGDITEIEVDAIVNAANRKLEHIGGLAKHLCDKGGPTIQTECDDIMARKASKYLQEGSVEVTTAGKLKNKIIIHAVGPTWNNGKSYEVESLAEAVTNSLSAAEQNKCSSIAFPAISTGIFRFPIDKATEVIVRNIKDYLENFPQSCLKYIYLVSIKKDIISAFQQQLQSIFPKEFGQLPKYTDGAYNQVVKSKSPPPPVKPKPARNVKNATKIEIELGLLNKIKCDAIVNTTNSALDLNSGAISKAILADAGDALQRECYKHSFASQRIVVTDGYNLPCSKVFHVCLPHWSQSSPDVIKSTMKNCLEKADTLNLQDIAFPAFGTGNLRYPPDIVATVMFSAASEYVSNTKTGLQKISFVIFPKDTVIKMAFENASSGTTTLPASVQDYDLPPRRNEPISDVLPQDNNFTVDINGIKLIILQGDIVDENADAIVHGTNIHFSLNGAVSRALLSKMGHQLTQDCKVKRAEMESQNYAITKAFSIAASYIVHVNMEGIKKHPDKIFRLCFDAAEGAKIKSLALPPVGTGGLGCTVNDITKSFLNALKSFGKSSPKYLKTVKFIVFNADTFTEICQIIGKETKSFFQKAASYLPSWPKRVTQTDQTEDVQIENISPSPASLFFYADSMRTVDKTKDSIISQYKKDYLICKEIEDKNISELPRPQVQKIMKLQHKHEVKIEMKSTKITISGYKDDALSVHGDIQSIILSFVNDMKSEQAAELMEKIVQWNYITYDQGKSKVEPYPREINQQLEEAYENDKMLTLNRGGKRIIFDMRKPEEMVEYEDTNPQKTIKIVRNDKTQGASLPEHWSPMGNSNYIKFQLKSGDEYDKVTNSFPANFQIVKIERIQNVGLYRKYKAHLEQIELTNPQGTTNETQGLWHGTSESVTEKINSHGFDRSYCGKNATAYGRGVYFARDAQYSLGSTYSPPDTNGHKRIYMCNVITGISCLGSSDLKYLPDNPQVPGSKFDSSVNDLTAPSIFVIFHDASAYPAYLITCH